MDLSDLTIQPGKVHLIREILHDGVTGSVRVLGSLESYDAAADAAVIGYKGHQLVVDTSLLADFQFRIASLYEFIGEIEASREGEPESEPDQGGGGNDQTQICFARAHNQFGVLGSMEYKFAIRFTNSATAEDGAASRMAPPPTPEKVKVHFKPIANAPILRKSKFQVNATWTCFELESSLRNMLQISDATPLFLYCSSAFEPSPDQSLSDLYKCFHVNKELLISYSITEAWV
ncbi:unnamed protein product [Scytosiphon promiscuus]